MSPDDARKTLNTLQLDKNKLAVKNNTFKISTENFKSIEITIIREDNNNILPIIMYFYGGGWILGNIDTHYNLLSKIALETHSAVVFVEYSLSPEAKYPKALNQCYEATEYIYKNAPNYKLDSNKLIVAGDGVGGKMAAIVAILAKEENNGPK